MKITDPKLNKKVEEGLMVLTSVQEYVSGLAGAVTDGGPTQEQLRNVALALIVEIVEMLQELDWKPWPHVATPLHTGRLALEYGDILSFLGLFTVYLNKLGLTNEQLADAYIDRANNNIRRFEYGHEQANGSGESYVQDRLC